MLLFGKYQNGRESLPGLLLGVLLPHLGQNMLSRVLLRSPCTGGTMVRIVSPPRGGWTEGFLQGHSAKGTNPITRAPLL